MQDTFTPVERRAYSQQEMNDIGWGLRGMVEKMSKPYFADRSVRRGHPDYQHNMYIV